MRTDSNNNPTAFTTDIAKEAGLVLGVDYEQGDPFSAVSPVPPYPATTYYTAKLIGDPVAITIRVIDTIGFYVSAERGRWTYIAIPKFLWDVLTPDGKRDVIGFMYQREGGTEMRNLFPNYGKL